MIETLKRNLPYLYVDEADGYSILTIIGTCVAEELSLQYQDVKFCFKSQCVVAENNKSGRNLSVDAAIILKKFQEEIWSPFILIEYKSGIATFLNHVKSADLLELLVQVYYTMLYYRQDSLIGCLTDLSSWHVFLLKRQNEKISVVKYLRLAVEFSAKFGKNEMEKIISLFVQLSPDMSLL